MRLTGGRIAISLGWVAAWDGRLAVDSVSSTLFVHWAEKLFSPAWVKRRAAGDMCAALREVMAELEKGFGRWQVKWGEMNRHQRFDKAAKMMVDPQRPSLPIAGAAGSLGVSFCYLSRRAEEAKERFGYHGHSYVAAVEFGEHTMARSVIPLGESRDPKSPHFEDQSAMYAGGKMKTARFTEDEVKAGAKRTYRPGEQAGVSSSGAR